MIIANSALRASLAIHHLICHRSFVWRKWRVVTFAWLRKFSPLFVLSKTFGSGELVKMEELQKKYVIKSFNSKSSRQKKLKFEEIDLSVYKSSAKCAAFVTSEDRILFWVKALQESYFDLLEDSDDYHIKWIDHLNSDDTGFEHIEMKVSRFTAVPDNRTTLFTITTYLTTGVVMCQGTSFELWCSNEFPRLKEKTERYYSIYNGSTATCDQDFVTCTPEERKTIINHLEEAFQITNANKKSKALKDCTSIPIPYHRMKTGPKMKMATISLVKIKHPKFLRRPLLCTGREGIHSTRLGDSLYEVKHQSLI